jgi:hypothetical protein
MIDERFINMFGVVMYELKGACNFGFHFIIVCDTVKRAFRLLRDAKAQCGPGDLANSSMRAAIYLIGVLLSLVAGARHCAALRERSKIPVKNLPGREDPSMKHARPD